MCVPNGRGPFAAVLLVHGGGWSSGDRTQAARALRGPLVAAGLAWIALDYRLAPRHRHPAAVEDVRAAVVWTKTHATALGLDPGRLALVGESAGGHVVVVGRRSRPARTRAWRRWCRSSRRSTWRRTPSDAAGSRPRCARCSDARPSTRDAPGAARRVAAAARAPGLPPFLLVHGTADMSVPYEQSLRLREALRSADVPCALVTVPDGHHGTRGGTAHCRAGATRWSAWLAAALRAR